VSGERRTRGLIDTKPRRRLADLMIASIATVNRVPLYTTNPDDFLGLDRLLTVVPVERPPTNT
jgi:predicted nucleic acid-binding protein